MGNISITAPLALTTEYASIDGRYTDANGNPYASVAAAEAALGRRMNQYTVGLTVLVADENDPDYPKAKEYWVQPYDNNGVTAYHLEPKQSEISEQVQSNWEEDDPADPAYIKNKPTIPNVPAISTSIAEDAASDVKTASPKAVKTYVDNNKPSIQDNEQGSTAVTLDGTIHVSAVDAQDDEGAGVEITPHTGGGVDMKFTLPKGKDAYEVYLEEYKNEHGGSTEGAMSKTDWLASLKGADGAEGAPGHNPCLGRFNVLPPLSPNPFADARKGDYIYFDTTDQQTSDPVTLIYHFDGKNWDAQGTPVDVINYYTFNSGQHVNDVKIKNEAGVEVQGTADVLSAEAGMAIKEKVILSRKNFGLSGTSPYFLGTISDLMPNRVHNRFQRDQYTSEYRVDLFRVTAGEYVAKLNYSLSTLVYVGTVNSVDDVVPGGQIKSSIIDDRSVVNENVKFYFSEETILFFLYRSTAYYNRFATVNGIKETEIKPVVLQLQADVNEIKDTLDEIIISENAPTTLADMVPGSINNGVITFGGNGDSLITMYPLNNADVASVTLVPKETNINANIDVKFFDAQWQLKNSQTITYTAAGAESTSVSWVNAYQQSGVHKYIMVVADSNADIQVTFDVKNALQLSDVELKGVDLKTLFSGRVNSDPNYLEGLTGWTAMEGNTSQNVELVTNSAEADTFGRAIKITKTTGVNRIGYTKQGVSLAASTNYLVAYRARVDSYDGSSNYIFQKDGIEGYLGGTGRFNPVTETTGGSYVSVIDTYYNESASTTDVRLGSPHRPNAGIFTGYLGRMDVVPLNGLTGTPTFKELSWAYNVYVAFLRGERQEDIRKIVDSRETAEPYISGGQARRVFIKEAQTYLNELGLTECTYTNPAGCEQTITTTVGAQTHTTTDKNLFNCKELLKVASQFVNYPKLLRRVAARRGGDVVMRGNHTLVIPNDRFSAYMGGTEQGWDPSAYTDAPSKALGDAYDIVMGKSGAWGTSSSYSTLTLICIARSKKYEGRLMIGVLHSANMPNSTAGTYVYDEMIKVFDNLEGVTDAAKPSCNHAAAGYIPDAVSSCRYVDWVEYTHGNDSVSRWNPASSIKMVTAMIVDEWLKDSDIIEYTGDCQLPSGSSGFSPKELGDRFEYKHLMPVAMMKSDNSMFYAMAKACGRKIALSRKDSWDIEVK